MGSFQHKNKTICEFFVLGDRRSTPCLVPGAVHLKKLLTAKAVAHHVISAGKKTLSLLKGMVRRTYSWYRQFSWLVSKVLLIVVLYIM
ncbi:hypothetical protein BDV24DRAFT_131292 [Aspergillus arachidicola]|uniref:Uncharacterized protein n=1 Tax=Aspergillus arachidicola TaxID=656916 RepID=A0A5N6YEN7_9EURO|nr:hypothetical protein BDV24DRAFT_131292 [Aspergillus arachidicola]